MEVVHQRGKTTDPVLLTPLTAVAQLTGPETEPRHGRHLGLKHQHMAAMIPSLLDPKLLPTGLTTGVPRLQLTAAAVHPTMTGQHQLLVVATVV
jgi:hypothetical protein